MTINLFKDVANELFKAFENKNISYSVVGNYEKLPEFTSNDVDIWVDDIVASETVMYEICQSKNVNLYLRNKTANGSNNYFYYEEAGAPRLVKIDLMSETAYKSIFTIIPACYYAVHKEKYKSFYVASEAIENVAHLLFPLVTFGVVKDKYKDKIRKSVGTHNFRVLLDDVLGVGLSEKVSDLITEGDWPGVVAYARRIKRKMIWDTIFRFDLRFVKRGVSFFVSVLKRAVNRNGMVVSFTGVDGAGKTSIKNLLVEHSDKYFTKDRTCQSYWRPFFLPRVAEVVRSAGQKERYASSGKRIVNRGCISWFMSHLKYIYYVLDFVLGRLKFFKNLHTGGLVVFDRYHLDNIIYPERFGFVVSKRFMRLVDRFLIPTPDVQFYFTADTQVLYDRKKEIDVKELEEQKATYLNEISRHRNIVVLDTGSSIEKTFDEVVLVMLGTLSRRYS